MKSTPRIFHELFIFFLTLYFILFILESLVPGLVSGTLSLNFPLGGVIIMGIIALFASSRDLASTHSKDIHNTFFNKGLGTIKKIILPLSLSCLVILIIAVGVTIQAQKSELSANADVQQNIINSVRETGAIEQPKLPPKISIQFLNGNKIEGEAVKMTDIATSSGFYALEATNAANYNYTTTQIIYQSNKEDADKIATIVAQRYKKYEIKQATESAQADVTVILGKK